MRTAFFHSESSERASDCRSCPGLLMEVRLLATPTLSYGSTALLETSFRSQLRELVHRMNRVNRTTDQETGAFDKRKN